MTEQPLWAGYVPSYSAMRGPLPPPQWDEVSQNLLDDLRLKLRESVTESILMALRGFFIPGPLGAAFDQLVEWASLLLDAQALLSAIAGEYEGDNVGLLAIQLIFAPIRQLVIWFGEPLVAFLNWLWGILAYVLDEFVKPVIIYLQSAWNAFVADWNQINWASPVTAIHQAWMLFVDFVLDFGSWLLNKIEETAGLSAIPSFFETVLLREVWATFNAQWAAISFNNISALWDALRALLKLVRGIVHWAAQVFQNLTGIDLEGLLDSLGISTPSSESTGWIPLPAL